MHFSAKNAAANTQKVVRWAEHHCDEYRDRFGDEVELTALEEAVMDNFEIDEEDFDEYDLSFAIFKHLQTTALL